MFKLVIVEDEKVASDNLIRMLSSVCPEGKVVACIESIKEAVKILPIAEYDLIFMDIHLSDGAAFSILDQVEISKPIIFTTAYDQYVLKAFKYLSIDYLLKPIDEKELQNAIEKFHKHFSAEETNGIDLTALQKVLKNETNFKERFLVQIGKKLQPVSVNEVAYFHSANKITFLNMSAEKSYPIEPSLSQLESELDPNKFFRINRQYILARNAIQHMYMFSPAKLKVVINTHPSLDLTVSIDRMAKFKNWFK